MTCALGPLLTVPQVVSGSIDAQHLELGQSMHLLLEKDAGKNVIEKL